MSARWQWFEPTHVTETNTLSFAPLNGVASAAQQLDLANDLDGSGPASGSEGFLITAFSRNSGVGDYTQDDEVAANGWIEVRTIGGGGDDLPAQTSGWTRLGRGRFMRIFAMPRETYRMFEFRLNIPVSAGVLAKDVRIRLIEGLRSISLEMGHYEGGAQGIVMGLGNSEFTDLLSGYLMTPQGSPDNTVTVSMGRRIIAGVPAIDLEETLTFSNLDAASAALAAGQEYLALVTKGAAGTTITKSPKGTAPLTEDDLPEVPAGERSIGFVRVPFDATISAGDIDQDSAHPLLYGCGAIIGTGLNPEIHPFEMMCGNNLLVSPSQFELILADDDLNHVWANVDGSVTAEVDGIQPTDLSMKLYEIEMTAGVQSAFRDCRQFLYPNPVEVHLDRAGVLNTGDEAHGVLATQAHCYLLPIGGICASLGDPGTTNETTWEIEASDRGGAFTTLFTDADPSQYPSIPFDAAEPTTFEALPQLLSFNGGTRFRSALTAEAGAGDSEFQSITLRFSAVGAA